MSFRNLDERFVAKILEIVLAFLRLPLHQHHFANAIVVERRRVTTGSPRVDAKDLVTLADPDRFRHAARLNVLNRVDEIFAEVRDVKLAYVTLVLGRRTLAGTSRLGTDRMDLSVRVGYRAR